MSEKIVEAVAKAITQALDESERVQILTRDEMMGKAARAAIEAYEAEKTRDLLAGMLVHEVKADGTVNYIERDKMMGNPSLHNKWLNDAVNRLAERKP